MESQSNILKTDEKLLRLVREFLLKMGSEKAVRGLSLDASLDTDLGIWSLERAQLFYEIENAFVVHLSDSVMAQASTLRDLVKAIENANPPGRILYHEFFPELESSEVDPSSCTTLIDILQAYAETEPDRIHIYLQDENGQESIIRYGKLFELSLKTAKGLKAKGLRPKETVAIMLPTCENFFYAFFGILLAGGIPVPIYPPFRPDKIEEYAKREAKILRNAEVRFLISFSEIQTLNKLLQNFIPSLKAVVTVESLTSLDSVLHPYEAEEQEPALIQYTSGSTGDPKGVLLSHGNLLANIRAFGAAANIKPTDVGVSWLPLYHDMGLIGSWLGCLYYGIPITIMSPLSFLNHPERWLWTIHYHRATVSAGPNFAYELCVSKIEDKAIEGLDLSSWRLAFNGAEAIYPKTIENFIKRFSAYKFKPTTFYPVYGLAESSVALTFPPLNREVRIDRISRESFIKDQIAVPAKASEKNCIEFVSCGFPLAKHDVRIVNEDGEEVSERTIGQLQFKGPSTLQGYYRNPTATRAIYHDGWWDSGDLAYKADQEIFITGRKKDVIIKAGRNLYPQEIEEVTGEVPGVRKGCVVAFGVTNPKRGTEQVIVVAETKPKKIQSNEKILHEITEKITLTIGEPPDHVVLVPPKTIPKTSSGKLQRSACKELYIAGKLARRSTPLWFQITKLTIISTWKKCSRFLAQIGKIFYTAYGMIILIATLIPVWLAILIFPQRIGVKISASWARNLFRLIGCPIEVKGRQYLSNAKNQSVIFVSNHMSYLDTLVLAGVLPTNVVIIGKRELLKAPILRDFIQKLGHLTVERMDFTESLADTQNILKKLQQGNSLLIFPEGTFSYAAGLRPFKLGAFKIATDTNHAIYPITIQGTRQILRAGKFLLTPKKITIWVGRPLQPRSRDWHEAIRLRTITRAEISKHGGEQVIDLVSAAPAQQ